MLGLLTWRKSRSSSVDNGPATLSKDSQPYLQQKAELEAKERGTYELEGRERVHEVDGVDAVSEMAVEREPPGMSTIQELRGAEHVKELEVPCGL